MSLTIAITNATFGGNKGAEAMLLVVTKSLAKDFPGCLLVIEKSRLLDAKIYKTREKQLKSQGIDVVWLETDLKNLFANLLFGYRASDDSIVNPDVVIDLGGLNFQDSSLRGALRVLLNYFPFIIRRTNIIFFTQDMGPMQRKLIRMIAGFILLRVKAIFVRSDRTMEELYKNFPKIRTRLLGPYPDCALALEAIATPRTNEDLRPVIILAPSIILYERYGKQYLDMFSDIIESLHRTHRFIILVHTFGANENIDDRFVAKKLAERHSKLSYIGDNLMVEELKGIIKTAEWVISSRYHVLVAALSENVPVISIGWNVKYKSLLMLYGIESHEVEVKNKKKPIELIYTQKSMVLVKQIGEKNTELKKSVVCSLRQLKKVIIDLVERKTEDCAS